MGCAVRVEGACFTPWRRVMKGTRVGSPRRARALHSAPRGPGPSTRAKRVAHTRAHGEPAMCERCGAVYQHKTWRAGERTRRAQATGVRWTLCPACLQVADQEYFGRVLIVPAPGREREIEIRRRIWNVEKRARHTQPERRTVRIDRAGAGLEVLTTSQALAHRIARELEKAFGGKSSFRWTDREGVLEATWAPPTERARRPSTRSRH